MKTAVILCFSDKGSETSEKIAAALKSEYSSRIVRCGKGQLAVETEKAFAESDALIFVSSCGIAVRAIAPFVVHKAKDPAVIVCDELGIHVIALLSGHIGGANELTIHIARSIHADPVITTATDINGRFSVDAWAARHALMIDSLAIAKRFSAEILKRDLPYYSDLPMRGEHLPAGLMFEEHGDLGLCVSIRKTAPFDETLKLIPKIVHFGIGCKRDTPAEKIRTAIDLSIEQLDLRPESIADISSIDVKANERGIIEVCDERQLPFRTYSADTLNSLPGSFSVSGFVRKTVGVDCVCERSAVMSAGNNARLILAKTRYDGVTCAAAIEDWRVPFE